MKNKIRKMKYGELFFGLAARHVIFSFSILLFSMIAVHDARALTISPTLKEFEIERGAQAQGSVVVRNESARAVEIDVVVKNFIARNENGAPDFTDTRDGLVEWIEVQPKKFTLARGASRKVDYTISIPGGVYSGGYSAGILFAGRTIGGATSGAITVNELASLILVRVPGDTLEKGRIAEFFIEKLEKNPVRILFSIRFENLGNVFLKPYGIITIRNIFGRKVAELSVNDVGGNVLPESGRRFNAEWSDSRESGGAKSFWFGRYAAEVEMFYGSKDAKQTARVSFWLINKQGTIAFVALILIVIVLVWKVIKKVRRKRFFVERI